MREVKDLINTKTGEKIYPKSHAQATYLSDGRNVEEVINNSVLYTEQSLTEEQQAQARENINAVSNDDTTYILSLSPEFNEEEGPSATGTLTKEQYDKIISCKNLVLELTLKLTDSGTFHQSVNLISKISEEDGILFTTNSHDISIGGTSSSIADIHATIVQFHPSTDGNTYSYQLFFYVAENRVYTTENTFVECDYNQYLTEEQQAQARKNINAVSANDIVNTECITKITYSELVSLRDNSQLMPGTWYRITDYITTTLQADTRSAGHQFDVLVLATDIDTLSEEAKVVQSEGDTYFSNSNLDAWKIWYSLDNDENRFAWTCPEIDTKYTYSVNYNDATYIVGRTTTVVYLGDITYYGWTPLDGSESTFFTLEDSPTENCVLYDENFTEISELIVTSETVEFGKGVIYRMIDEWGNDIPYDFKNIQFTPSIGSTSGSGGSGGASNIAVGEFDEEATVSEEETTEELTELLNASEPIYYYTFDLNGESDFSLTGYCYDNVIGKWFQNIESITYVQSLNKIIFKSTSNSSLYSNTFGDNCYDNTFGDGCYSNTFGDNCYDNTFGSTCISNTFGNSGFKNTFGDSCESNTFGDSCYDNSFGNNCNTNTFGDYCYNNTFGNECNSNIFGTNCTSNTFGDSCYDNSFGNNCNTNTFGDNFDSNTFGDNCNTNTFGDSCYSNSFGSMCYSNSFEYGCNSNTFGDSCYSNSFGDRCYSNSFGDRCYSNTFGDSCYSNSFGSKCNSNTFGDRCYSNTFGSEYIKNTFGDSCNSNTFGDNCYRNTFGDIFYSNSFGNGCTNNSFRMSASEDGELRDYCYYNIFENGVSWVVLYNTSTASSSYTLQNVTVCQGMSGTGKAYNVVEISELNAEYQIRVAKDLEGNILVYNPDTNIIKTTYSELVELRDNGKLIPGMGYRITDYVTTTGKPDTQSAEHQFDIIVNALDENTLSEDAKACLHEGDTYFSEAGANLEAWKIWYCLDNDISRFNWALPKGKKIVVDASEIGMGIVTGTLNGTFVYNDTPYTRWDTSLSLNGMTFNIYILTPSEDVTIGSTPLLYIVLKGGAIESGTITSVIINETEGKGVIYRMIDEWNNDVPYDFKNIQFKRKLTDGVLDLESGTDTFCYTFTSINESNLIDESFNTATSNVFGVKCWDNVFIGIACCNNSFGNGCYSNTFRNLCDHNSFGNDCSSNYFGDGCHSNSFGNDCTNNCFGNDANNLKSFYQYNSFGDGCKYINLANAQSDDFYHVQNYKLAQGLQGTPSSPITITTVRDRSYETKVAKNSTGEVKIYCEEDFNLTPLATTTTNELEPNNYYMLGTIEENSLSIVLNPPTFSNYLNEYLFEFNAGVDNISLSITSNIGELKWANDEDIPTIVNGKTYQFSIINNVIVYTYITYKSDTTLTDNYATMSNSGTTGYITFDSSVASDITVNYINYDSYGNPVKRSVTVSSGSSQVSFSGYNAYETLVPFITSITPGSDDTYTYLKKVI